MKGYMIKTTNVSVFNVDLGASINEAELDEWCFYIFFYFSHVIVNFPMKPIKKI